MFMIIDVLLVLLHIYFLGRVFPAFFAVKNNDVFYCWWSSTNFTCTTRVFFRIRVPRLLMPLSFNRVCADFLESGLCICYPHMGNTIPQSANRGRGWGVETHPHPSYWSHLCIKLAVSIKRAKEASTTSAPPKPFFKIILTYDAVFRALRTHSSNRLTLEAESASTQCTVEIVLSMGRCLSHRLPLILESMDSPSPSSYT